LSGSNPVAFPPKVIPPPSGADGTQCLSFFRLPNCDFFFSSAVKHQRTPALCVWFFFGEGCGLRSVSLAFPQIPGSPGTFFFSETHPGFGENLLVPAPVQTCSGGIPDLSTPLQVWSPLCNGGKFSPQLPPKTVFLDLYLPSLQSPFRSPSESPIYAVFPVSQKV